VDPAVTPGPWMHPDEVNKLLASRPEQESKHAA
jgi:hypothetical protein